MSNPTMMDGLEVLAVLLGVLIQVLWWEYVDESFFIVGLCKKAYQRVKK